MVRGRTAVPLLINLRETWSCVISLFLIDPKILTKGSKAFITYVRPLLESDWNRPTYCTPVWSSLTVCNINKTESCQRWFTKRIKGLYGLDYSIAAINIPRFRNFRGQKNKIRPNNVL